MGASRKYPARDGFTLIEMSIVLVVIGLLIGSVLVGQDMIRAAEVRAQITQIEKYNTAVNTFHNKYGALPGDLNQQVANTFGLIARGSSPGQGDGNGIIEGFAGNSCGFCAGRGEGPVVWVDLSAAAMIEGTFTTATEIAGSPVVTGNNFNPYFPAAKIGRGNFVYVWAGGYNLGWNGTAQTGSDSQNYFGLSSISSLFQWTLSSLPGLTVQEAYAIDKKVDDGFPQSGNITAQFINWNVSQYAPAWAAGGGGVGASSSNAPTTTATAGSNTTCYDNGSVAGATQQYSIEISNGANVNCALSFRFQ
jgi:prepilin-type N-terminal cleavage/methylation domain-containing protein